MSKKKLNISPLPEQRDDYSHYEEDVVRWDRVLVFAGVVLLVLALIIAGIYSSLSEQSEPESDAALSQVSASEDEVTQSASEKAREQEPTKYQEQGAGESASLTRSSQSEAPQVVVATAPEATSVPEAKLVPEDKPVPENKPEPVIEPTAALESKPATELPALAKEPESKALAKQETQSRNPASVLILNSQITEAALSLSYKKGKPGPALMERVRMPESGLIKVILYNEMKGLRGKVLYHEWYRNGKRQARVKIPVNVALQQSHSSKFIDRHMLGDWQVTVVDQNGEPYVLADFTVLAAE